MEDIKSDIKQIKSSLEELKTEKDETQLVCVRAELELSIENVLDRLEQLEKENEELKEKIKKAYKYITDEMYIDDNPTICGDEWEDTITELPISLHLYNEDLRELLDLLD